MMHFVDFFLANRNTDLPIDFARRKGFDLSKGTCVGTTPLNTMFTPLNISILYRGIHEQGSEDVVPEQRDG